MHQRDIVGIFSSLLTALGHKWDYRLGGDPVADAYPVLKLHGSMNWGRDGKKRVKVFESYEKLRGEGAKLEIVPPTWNKVISPALSEVWKNANEVLSTATNIIVVGFSMPPTDLHVKYLLAAGVKGNVSLRKIIFVDPNPDIPERANVMFSPRETRTRRVEIRAARLEELYFDGPHEPVRSFTLKSMPDPMW